MIKELLGGLTPLTESLRAETRPVFLYGMGDGAEKIAEYLKTHGITPCGVVASEGFVRGQEFLGFTVTSIDAAAEKHGELCLVVCFGVEGEKSRFLYDLAKKHRVAVPNLPVFGDGACDADFIRENSEKFEKVYSMLEDELSRDVFKSIVSFNITGDIEYLKIEDSFDAPEEFYMHGGRHIDVGAYDGDTALEFAEKCGTYSDIVAYEPDPRTYKKLLSNTKDIRGILPKNLAAAGHDGSVAATVGGGRASHCGEGDGVIGCERLDTLCGYTHIHACGVPVGSIKIDAEGMDEAVICGAVNTVYCERPSISVALYHRAEDIIEIPLLLRKHNNKYKFYLRKKEYIPAWDVFLYAIDGGKYVQRNHTC